MNSRSSRPVLASVPLPCGRLRADEQLGSNAKSAAGSMPKATHSDRTRLIARDGHSLDFGLSQPPTASQVSVGLRSRSGHRKHSYALMTRTSAGEPQSRPIPLNTPEKCRRARLSMSARGAKGQAATVRRKEDIIVSLTRTQNAANVIDRGFRKANSSGITDCRSCSLRIRLRRHDDSGTGNAMLQFNAMLVGCPSWTGLLQDHASDARSLCAAPAYAWRWLLPRFLDGGISVVRGSESRFA
jgi:hypothetical protein